MNRRKLRQEDGGKSKQVVNIRVTVHDSEVYEVESCWSQQTQEFCEKIAEEVKKFVEAITSKPRRRHDAIA